MAIIGQDKLVNKILNMTLDSLPHTILLIGEKGSGKSLLCQFIADTFKFQYFDLVDANKQVAMEFTNYSVTIPTLYRFDVNTFNTKNNIAQVVLKMIEEPAPLQYIILTAESKSQCIPTILNRCQQWYMEKYPIEILRQFTSNEDVLKFAHTPGQCLSLTAVSIDEMQAYANLIYDKIHTACLSNVLFIANKLSYNNDEAGFDFNLFIDICQVTVTNKVKESDDIKYIKYYELTNKLNNNRRIPAIDKRRLFENFLINLKEIADEYSTVKRTNS